MGSLPRRIAAVTLGAAALLGVAGGASTASATTIAHFRSSGSNPVYAGQRAWAAAYAAGYTDAQCGQETDQPSRGYWVVIVTCVS
jgi:hypothetical protein